MMKFYKLKRKQWDNINKYSKESIKGSPKVYPYASADFIKDSYIRNVINNGYLDDKKIVLDLPIMDFFSCISISSNKEYDWILLDAYYLAGAELPLSINGFLCSDKLKNVLTKNDFILGYDWHFYPAFLKYQKQYFKYYLFQFIDNSNNEIIWKHTILKCDGCKINNLNGKLLSEKIRSFKYHKSIKDLSIDYVFMNYSDILILPKMKYRVISERLKNILQLTEITGFEYEEISNITIGFINK